MDPFLGGRWGFGGEVEGHGSALGIDDAAGGGLDGLGGGEGMGAAAAGPASEVMAFDSIQAAAGIGFQVREDGLRRGFGSDDHMDVVRTDMGSDEGPIAVVAGFLNGFENEASSRFGEDEGRGEEAGLVGGEAAGVGRDRGLARLILVAVDGAVRVAVEVSAVGGEGQQEGHERRWLTFCAARVERRGGYEKVRNQKAKRGIDRGARWC